MTAAVIAALVAVAAVQGVQLRRILDRLAAAETVAAELRADLAFLDELATVRRVRRLAARDDAARAAVIDRVLTDEHQRPEGGWA